MSLGGGFKYIYILYYTLYILYILYIVYFYPYYLGKIPILTFAYFSNGWVKNHQLGHQLPSLDSFEVASTKVEAKG